MQCVILHSTCMHSMCLHSTCMHCGSSTIIAWCYKWCITMRFSEAQSWTRACSVGITGGLSPKGPKEGNSAAAAVKNAVKQRDFPPCFSKFLRGRKDRGWKRVGLVMRRVEGSWGMNGCICRQGYQCIGTKQRLAVCISSSSCRLVIVKVRKMRKC